MTQEEKSLLLQDLCARLPYGVKVQPSGSASPHKFVGYDKSLVRIDTDQRFELGNIKPYLRPMSSMTEEEKKEFSIFGFEVIDHINANRDECPKYQVIEASNFSEITNITDWLNAHHFDFHNLIERGLALETPEGMYNIKEE